MSPASSSGGDIPASVRKQLSIKASASWSHQLLPGSARAAKQRLSSALACALPFVGVRAGVSVAVAAVATSSQGPTQHAVSGRRGRRP
jgi:predicted ATPase